MILRPFRADTVGKPLPGIEVRIASPGPDGIGEVAVRGKTVMSHYLDDPELTAETIVDGWLMTGDLGRLDADGHLQLFGRKKNMIVTDEGKNIYPEDIENVFEGLAVKEFCVFAANYLWPARTMVGEQLVMVLHPEPGQAFSETLRAEITRRNQRLLPYKRISGYLVVGRRFSAHRFAQDQARRAGRADPAATASARPCVAPVNQSFLAIVNPAAGGGRCGRLAQALWRSCAPRASNWKWLETSAPGQATALARAAYARGVRQFSPWAETAPPSRSSTALFPEAATAGGRAQRSAFFRWEPAIRSCAISPTAARSTPPRRLSRVAGERATCFA